METSSEHLEALRAREHPWCVACSAAHPAGLRLRFEVAEEGRVRARFHCAALLQGYRGVLHGGIIASVLDAAMANCLFARGEAAVTAEMTIRFHRPVPTGRPADVSAWVSSDLCPLFLVEAELSQDGEVLASASAKFLRREC